MVKIKSRKKVKRIENEYLGKRKLPKPKRSKKKNRNNNKNNNKNSKVQIKSKKIKGLRQSKKSKKRTREQVGGYGIKGGPVGIAQRDLDILNEPQISIDKEKLQNIQRGLEKIQKIVGKDPKNKKVANAVKQVIKLITRYEKITRPANPAMINKYIELLQRQKILEIVNTTPEVRNKPRKELINSQWSDVQMVLKELKAQSQTLTPTQSILISVLQEIFASGIPLRVPISGTTGTSFQVFNIEPKYTLDYIVSIIGYNVDLILSKLNITTQNILKIEDQTYQEGTIKNHLEPYINFKKFILRSKYVVNTEISIKDDEEEPVTQSEITATFVGGSNHKTYKQKNIKNIPKKKKVSSLQLPIKKNLKGGATRTPQELYDYILQLVLPELGKCIDIEDRFKDFEHDFTKGDENNQLRKYLPDLEYDEHITYIPLDLSAKKKDLRGPWKSYIDMNLDIQQQLINIENENTYKIIDAGSYKLAAFNGEMDSTGKNITKHLSNLVDPATTGVNSDEIPYIKKSDLDYIGITVNKFMEYLDYFIKNIPPYEGDPNILGILIEGNNTPETYINSKFTFDIFGKVIKYYKNGTDPGSVSFEYNASQSIMATGINKFVGTTDNPIYNDVKPRSKAQITEQEYNFIYGAWEENSPHWFRRMKYMGDKSHIVLAIIYALNEHNHKVVIHTLDRLLYKTVCQVIICAKQISMVKLEEAQAAQAAQAQAEQAAQAAQAAQAPDEQAQAQAQALAEQAQALAEQAQVFQKIYNNLGVLYGCSHQIANVLKEPIFPSYDAYSMDAHAVWVAGGKSIDTLGEYAYFAKPADPNKIAEEKLNKIYAGFTKETDDESIILNILGQQKGTKESYLLHLWETQINSYSDELSVNIKTAYNIDTGTGKVPTVTDQTLEFAKLGIKAYQLASAKFNQSVKFLSQLKGIAEYYIKDLPKKSSIFYPKGLEDNGEIKDKNCLFLPTEYTVLGFSHPDKSYAINEKSEFLTMISHSSTFPFYICSFNNKRYLSNKCQFINHSNKKSTTVQSARESKVGTFFSKLKIVYDIIDDSSMEDFVNTAKSQFDQIGITTDRTIEKIFTNFSNFKSHLKEGLKTFKAAYDLMIDNSVIIKDLIDIGHLEKTAVPATFIPATDTLTGQVQQILQTPEQPAYDYSDIFTNLIDNYHVELILINFPAPYIFDGQASTEIKIEYHIGDDKELFIENINDPSNPVDNKIIIRLKKTDFENSGKRPGNLINICEQIRELYLFAKENIEVDAYMTQ